jgi:hypothetical protein
VPIAAALGLPAGHTELNEVTSLFFDAHGTLWIGTRNTGFYHATHPATPQAIWTYTKMSQ